jgi:hypothetical protein
MRYGGCLWFQFYLLLFSCRLRTPPDLPRSRAVSAAADTVPGPYCLMFMVCGLGLRLYTLGFRL